MVKTNEIIFKNKTFQWVLAWYLMIGAIYLIYKVAVRVISDSLWLLSGSSIFHYVIANTIWYPLYFLQDIGIINSMFYWTTMTYLLFYIIGIYLFTHYIIIPFTHWIHLKKTTIITMIHITMLVIAIGISLVTIPSVSYDEKEILKDYNFKNLIYDFTELAEKSDVEDGLFKGFATTFNTSDGETETLKLYFVNNYYAENYDQESREDGNKSFWGLAMYGSQQMYINYEDMQNFVANESRRNDKIREKYNVSSDIDENLYEFEIEQTLVHEIGHHLDNYDLIGDEKLIYFQNKSYVDKEYFLGLYDDYGKEMGYYGRDVNFEIILFDGGYNNYQQSDWKQEIITRVNSVCLRLDPEKNYNEFKLQDWEYCKQFNISQEAIDNYNMVIQQIVLSYVDTYVATYGQGTELNFAYRDNLIKDTCYDECKSEPYYEQPYCEEVCKIRVNDEIIKSIGVDVK